MKKVLFLVSFVLVFLTSMTLLDRDGSDSLVLYPHPIVKKTTLSSTLQITNVSVYNILGTKVLDREGEGELDFTDLPSGYYIIKATSNKGELIKRVQKN